MAVESYIVLGLGIIGIISSILVYVFASLELDISKGLGTAVMIFNSLFMLISIWITIVGFRGNFFGLLIKKTSSTIASWWRLILGVIGVISSVFIYIFTSIESNITEGYGLAIMILNTIFLLFSLWLTIVGYSGNFFDLGLTQSIKNSVSSALGSLI